MVAKIDQIIKHFNHKLINFDLRSIEKNQNGILDGRLGMIYYFFQMYKVENDQLYVDKIAELLEDVFENCQNKDLKISNDLNFCDGLSGLGLIIKELMASEILDEGYHEQLTIINDLALKHSLNAIKENNFDFFYGAIGTLYYLNEVGHISHCETIIDALYEVALQSDYLFYNQNDDDSNRGINFGLAHGNAAIQMVLINILQNGCKKKELSEMIEKGINQLHKFEKEENINSSIKSYFPHNVTIESGTEKISRSIVLGWCNSEIDLALLFNRFHEVSDTLIYSNTVSKIGMESVKRKTEDTTGVEDYHFCHGSSGIAQLYNKLLDQTKEETYHHSYQYWINETIKYLEKEKDEETNGTKINFLYGWPGALLTLNEYNNPEIKGWDKLFLI